MKRKPTLKSFLMETNYGSLVNKKKFDDLDHDERQLYLYTADGVSVLSSAAVENLAKKYPAEAGEVFRGLHFDTEEDYQKFRAGFVDGGDNHLNSMSSWSSDIKTASEFAHSKKTYFPTADIMSAHMKMKDEGEHMTGHGGVILKTVIAEGQGIDVNKTGFAKESEVILPAGTYKISIEKDVLPFKRQYQSLGMVQAAIKKIKAKSPDIGDERGLDVLAEYFTKSWINKLTPADCDVLFMHFYGKALEHANKQPEAAVSITMEKNTVTNEIELDIRVTSLLSSPLLNKLSEGLRKKVRSVNTKIARTLKTKISEIGDIGTAKSISVRGVKGLFEETGIDATKLLKQKLADLYHRMNSREYMKTLTTDDLKKHADRTVMVLRAMSDL